MDNDVCTFDYDSPSYTGYCTGCRINPKLTIYHSANEHIRTHPTPGLYIRKRE